MLKSARKLRKSMMWGKKKGTAMMIRRPRMTADRISDKSQVVAEVACDVVCHEKKG